VPQAAQSGSVMKRTFGQHAGHKACTVSTSSPHDGQRGGNIASSRPTPSRRTAGHTVVQATVGQEGCKSIAV
jgi:hypothetical protein